MSSLSRVVAMNLRFSSVRKRMAASHEVTLVHYGSTVLHEAGIMMADEILKGFKLRLIQCAVKGMLFGGILFQIKGPAPVLF